MGRRLNISTPTVINTELVPLDDSFYIEANGQTEQWYYDNTNQFAPNRITTPLTLTPKISAFDQDTQTSYVPSFQSIGWYEQAWDETQQDYVETLITNHVDSSSAEYVISNNNLIVKKNVPYTHAITIRCAAVYTDPRDAGVSCTVETTVVLLTNRDAEVISPTLDILCPPSLAFNPLKDYSSNVATRSNTMKAIASWAGIIPTELLSCKVDPLGTEELIPNNIENLVTCTPYLDIRYGVTEQQDQQFLYRQTSGGLVNPIDGNTSYVSKIKGNTVVWNQFCPDFTNQMWIVYNISASIEQNGLKIASTRTSGLKRFYIRLSDIGHFDTTHKYYVSCYIDCTNFQTYAAFGFFIQSNAYTAATVLCTAGESIVSSVIANITNATYMGFRLDNAATPDDGYVLFKNPIAIDLTLIFGAGNEPTTVEAFESWLSTNIGLKDYYPYNEGELIPVRMTGMKTVGFNLWDEQWENGYYNNEGNTVLDSRYFKSKNLIKVIGGQTYYMKTPSSVAFHIREYDSNKNLLSVVVNGKQNPQFTVSSNAHYIGFNTANANVYTTYNNDICINISDQSRNGTYAAHWEDTSVFDVTTVKGKLNGQGQDVYIFPYGMKKAGTIQDEIKVENGVVKAIKRIGSVDLGTLTWSHTTYHWDATLVGYKHSGNNDTGHKMIAQHYVKAASFNSIHGGGHVLGFEANGFSYNNYIIVNNGSETEQPFGYLYYELATYEEYTIDPSTLPRGFFEWYGVENGVEVKADTLPWYVSGQNTDTLTIDPMYGEKIAVVLRAKKNQSDTSLYPAKAYRNVIWRIPNIDTHVVCANGGAVRSDTQRMDFSSISNANGEVLDDNTKLEQLAFKWVSRRNNESVENNQGWGHEKSITAGDLRNTIGAGQSSLASTMVFPYVYLKGAFEKVTDNSELVTDGGETVYDRPIE